MLVLTRKMKEEIRIGNDITVTIVRVKGQSVRVGINAPPHIHIVRSELVDTPQSKTESSAPSEPPTTPIQTTNRTGPPATDQRPVTGAPPSERKNPTDFDCRSRFDSPLRSTRTFSQVVARHRSNT